MRADSLHILFVGSVIPNAQVPPRGINDLHSQMEPW